MYTVKAISLLALAGSAVAAPQWGNWGQGKYWHGGEGDSKPTAVQTDVAVVTAYTTVTYGGNWGQPTPASETPAPAPPADTPAPAPPADTWAPAPPADTATPSAPAPAPSASAPAASSNDGTYMSVVAEWRSKMGMSALTEDSTLAANALKTAVDGKGQMIHELNPGSMAQVLAPGDTSDFEKCFVGGWLCEVPTLPGLDGICDTMSQGWAYGGETGHADILSSTSYSKIGCGNAEGIWACDLA